MKHVSIKFFQLVGLLLLAAIPARLCAQSNVVDEVIWVVGDEAILLSDVEKARASMTSTSGNPYCVIPENLAIQKLFLHQAKIDSIDITITDEMVSRYADSYLSEWVKAAGSREKLEEYRNMSYAQIREETCEMLRDNQIMKAERDHLTRNIKVTPAEVRHYFKDFPEDSLPLIPTQVEVEIITEHPRVRQEEIDRVKNELRDFSERITSGKASFSALATFYSEDGSARQGGELDYHSKAELDPAFANVAWSLTDPKKVSKIVESQYGYHIIQLIDKRGEKLKLRHILLRAKVDPMDVEASIARLDSIADDIRKGTFTFEAAASTLSDDKNTRSNKGLMSNNSVNPETGERMPNTSRFKMGDLPTDIARVVSSMQVGEISKAFSMLDANGKEQCCIVKLKNRIPAHPASVTEDYQILQDIVVEKRSEEFIDKWIREKQRTTYVRINPEWRDCDFKYPNWGGEK